MKNLILILVGCLIFIMTAGCLGKNNVSKEIVHQEQLAMDSLNTPDLPDVSKELSFFEKTDISPVDLKRIKKKYDRFDGFTSGMLGNKETKMFYRPAKEGFYGFYSLLGVLHDDYKIDGELIVFNNEYPWYYDNDTDIFIELTAYGFDILVFEDIHVGMTEQKLRTKLGQPYYDKDGVLLYIAKNKKLIAVFKITDNHIEWLKVGYYNDAILNNPEANISILTKVISV